MPRLVSTVMSSINHSPPTQIRQNPLHSVVSCLRPPPVDYVGYSKHASFNRIHSTPMRKAYWDFIDNLISIDNKDHLLTDKRPPKQKRLFQYIKSLRKECSGVPSLKQGDLLITDTIGKAEALNDQYQSVFTKEPPGPIPDKGTSPYQTMEDLFITEAGVLKLLQNIKVDKATGPDAIAARVMRETAVDLAPVLTTIFTHSINTESVPEDWKKANVNPIFKKGSKYSPSNYRPVLFLAYINDLHESITNSNVKLFADDCVLYRDITDRNDTTLLQQYLDALGRWEAKWLMEFNVDKCFVMHATHSKHKIQHQYTLHNQTLTPVKHSKYLGVTLPDDVT